MMGSFDISALQSQLEEARIRLAEAEETLQAIRRGEVDAVVIEGEAGPQIYALKSADEPYRMIVEQMREGAVTIAGDGTILYCNNAFASMICDKPERIVGSSLVPLVEGGKLELLIDADQSSGQELRLRRSDESWIACNVSSTPLTIDDRTVHCLVATDLTRQTLWQRHEAILDSTSDAIYSLSPDLTVETWNQGAVRLYGYELHEIIGRSERILCHDQDAAVLDELVTRVGCENLPARVDMARRRKDGSLLHVIVSLAPLRNEAGELAGYAVIEHDITERKAAERTQKMLLGELSHRVKNTLAAVQSIANHTLRNVPEPAEFAATFSGRVQAMARAHDVLTQRAWQGADVATLISEQLLIGSESSGRVLCAGPDIMLDAQAALVLALMLHELGTNARKHGALKSPQGKVLLEWKLGERAPETLQLTWRETDGPRVTSPSRRGFGSQLIEHSLSTIGGSAAIHFEPAGVRCEMIVPLRRRLDLTENGTSWREQSVS